MSMLVSIARKVITAKDADHTEAESLEAKGTTAPGLTKEELEELFSAELQETQPD